MYICSPNPILSTTSPLLDMPNITQDFLVCVPRPTFSPIKASCRHPPDLSHAIRTLGGRPSSSTLIVNAFRTVLLHLRWDPTAQLPDQSRSCDADCVALSALICLKDTLGRKYTAATRANMAAAFLERVPDLVQWLTRWSSRIARATAMDRADPEVDFATDIWCRIAEYSSACHQLFGGIPAFREIIAAQVPVMLDLWLVRSDSWYSQASNLRLEVFCVSILREMLFYGCEFKAEIIAWLGDGDNLTRAARVSLSRVESNLSSDGPVLSRLQGTVQEIIFLRSFREVSSDFYFALSQQKVVARLTRCLLRLSSDAFKALHDPRTGQVSADNLHSFMAILEQISCFMRLPNAIACTEDAIREGALLVILRCWQFPRKGRNDPNSLVISAFLKVIALRAPYFNVARSLKTSISGIKRNHPELTNGNYSMIWRGLSSCEEFTSIVRGSRRHCWVSQCRKRESGGAHFSRCASCLVVYYCSPMCQLFHWKYGGHRNECSSLRDARQASCDPKPIDIDHVNFFRKIVMYRLRESATLQQLREVSEKPFDELYLIIEINDNEVRVLPQAAPRASEGALLVSAILDHDNDQAEFRFRRITFKIKAHRKTTAYLPRMERLIREIQSARGPKITYTGEGFQTERYPTEP
ncbi:hypothetical protein HGRIS_013666 [Hohenbuehelia grisea]|uniref:MYND-type domain-containing protein n=1 Tax=Hohenbuehelia grisea TaxID=104357 RepID=A0ABR3IWF9_9AGAR